MQGRIVFYFLILIGYCVILENLLKKSIFDRYAYYEKGKTQPPLFMLMKLAQLYDVTTDYLLGIQKAERQTSRFETELLLLVKKHFGDEAAPFR